MVVVRPWKLRAVAGETPPSDEKAVRALQPDGAWKMYNLPEDAPLAHWWMDQERRRGFAVDVEDATVQEELSELAAFESEIDTAQQVKRLRQVLRQLPPKCHAAVVLQYVHGLSYQQIAERLDVSPRMVKKYLGQALGHCRRRMSRRG